MIGTSCTLSVGELLDALECGRPAETGVPENERKDRMEPVGEMGVDGAPEPYVCEIALKGGVESRAGGVKRRSLGVLLCRARRARAKLDEGEGVPLFSLTNLSGGTAGRVSRLGGVTRKTGLICCAGGVDIVDAR